MAKPFAPKLKRPIKIAVINRKGGVGKTNTTINLACEFVNRGYSTVIADTEKEGGCVHWQSLAGDNAKVPVVGMYDPMIKVNIKAYEGSNDIILIDTAGIIVDMDDEEDGKPARSIALSWLWQTTSLFLYSPHPQTSAQQRSAWNHSARFKSFAMELRFSGFC